MAIIIFSILFATLNVSLLYFSRHMFIKSDRAWLIPLAVLFSYFFAKVALHQESTLLACFDSKEYRKYMSDVLLEPMIVLWSVILGAMFFSGRSGKGGNRTSYIVSVVEQKNLD